MPITGAHNNAGYGQETGCLTRQDVLKRQHMIDKLPAAGSCSALVNKSCWKRYTLGARYDYDEGSHMEHQDGSENARFQDPERRSSRIYHGARVDPGQTELPVAGSSSRVIMRVEQMKVDAPRPGDFWHNQIGRPGRVEDGRVGRTDHNVPIDFVQKKAKGLCSVVAQPTDHLAHDMCDTRFTKPKTKRTYEKRTKDAPHDRIWKFDPNSDEVDPAMVKGGIRRGAEDNSYQSGAACCIYGRACEDAAIGDHNPHNKKKKADTKQNGSAKIWNVLDRRGMDEHLNAKGQQAWTNAEVAGFAPGEAADAIFRASKREVEGKSNVGGVAPWLFAAHEAGCDEDVNTLATKYISSSREAQERVLYARSQSDAKERNERASLMQRSQSARFSTTSEKDSAAPSQDRARTPPPRKPPRSDGGSYAAQGSRASGDPSPFMNRGARDTTPPPSALGGSRSSRDFFDPRGGGSRSARDAYAPPSAMTQSVDFSQAGRDSTPPRRDPRRERSDRGATPPRASRSVTPPRAKATRLEGSQSVIELPANSPTESRWSL